MTAVYPFIGGTASTHKFNLKDPRDLDVAFRLTFSNDTHTNEYFIGYGDSHIYNPDMDVNDTHIAIYAKSIISGNRLEIGLVQSTQTHGIGISIAWGDGNIYTRGYNVYTSRGVKTNGFHQIICGQDASNSFYIKNGTSYPSSNPSTAYRYTGNIGVGGGIIGISPSYGSKILFASIGHKMTSSEGLLLSGIVEEYQTALGRQV